MFAKVSAYDFLVWNSIPHSIQFYMNDNCNAFLSFALPCLEGCRRSYDLSNMLWPRHWKLKLLLLVAGKARNEDMLLVSYMAVNSDWKSPHMFDDLFSLCPRWLAYLLRCSFDVSRLFQISEPEDLYKRNCFRKTRTAHKAPRVASMTFVSINAGICLFIW